MATTLAFVPFSPFLCMTSGAALLLGHVSCQPQQIRFGAPARMIESRAVMAIGNGENALTPPLKWAGGKRWQLPYLRKYWEREDHRRLVEPFCGGLAVTLGLRPERALLNDANPHLINFYEWVKRGFRISLEMKNEPILFYEHRARLNQLIRQNKEKTR